jgi:hypothetical protein
MAVNNLGEVYFALGDLDVAAQCYVKARDICRGTGSYVEGRALHNLGAVYLRLHRRVSLAAATRIFEQVGDRGGAAQTASLLAALTAELARGSLGRPRRGKAAPQMRNALIRAHAVCRLDFAGASNTQRGVTDRA